MFEEEFNEKISEIINALKGLRKSIDKSAEVYWNIGYVDIHLALHKMAEVINDGIDELADCTSYDKASKIYTKTIKHVKSMKEKHALSLKEVIS